MALIEVAREGPVIRVALNRPEVRNAFNDELVAELTAWARAAGEERDARVAVLAGAGPVFCAGADAAWMARMRGYSLEENVRDAGRLADLFEALDTLPLPLVGRIHGAAMGGGAGLAAVCDVAVAAAGTRFGFTEVRLGIVPGVISPYVVDKIGVSAARALFVTGERFDAARAREIGLVHLVAPDDALDAAVAGVVAELLQGAPGAQLRAKRLVAEVKGRPRAAVREETARAIAERRVSAEGQEGLAAFLGKRKPTWQE